CTECGSIWSSADGRHWTRDAALSPSPAALDVATDGRRVVVVEESCPNDACRTVTWTSADGRTAWSLSPGELPIVRPRVAFAAGETIPGTGFVHLFSSPNGLTWTEIQSDLDLGECDVAALAGAADRLLLVGDGDCRQIWVSRAPS